MPPAVMPGLIVGAGAGAGGGGAGGGGGGDWAAAVPGATSATATATAARTGRRRDIGAQGYRPVARRPATDLAPTRRSSGGDALGRGGRALLGAAGRPEVLPADQQDAADRAPGRHRGGDQEQHVQRRRERAEVGR